MGQVKEIASYAEVLPARVKVYRGSALCLAAAAISSSRSIHVRPLPNTGDPEHEYFEVRVRDREWLIKQVLEQHATEAKWWE